MMKLSLKLNLKSNLQANLKAALFIACGTLLFNVTTSIAKESNPEEENRDSQTQEKSNPPGTHKLYKGIDKNGNVSYSDQPSPGSEEITVADPPTIRVIKTPEVLFKPEEQAEPAQELDADYYKNVSFSNLENDGVIRNNGGIVTLTASLQPALRKEHLLKFFLDGKLLGEKQKELTVVAESIEYGPHIASYTIVSNNDEIVQSSAVVKFNLLHVVRPKTGATNSGEKNNVASNILKKQLYQANLPELPKVPTYDSMKKTNQTDK